MTAEIEVELFGIVLDAIGLGEIVNEAVEINLVEVGNKYELMRYELPRQV